MEEARIQQVVNYKAELEKHQTIYELKFWNLLLRARAIKEQSKILKGTQLSTIQRQKIFTNGRTAYIADFYCSSYRLAFEIDGSQHDKNKEYDQKRTEFIQKEFGVRVVRFKNSEIGKPDMLDKVLAELHR